jgi:hypothetical protein
MSTFPWKMSQNLQTTNDQLTIEMENDIDNKFFEEKVKFEQFIDFILEDTTSSKDIFKLTKRIRDNNRLRESCSKSDFIFQTNKKGD